MTIESTVATAAASASPSPPSLPQGRAAHFSISKARRRNGSHRPCPHSNPHRSRAGNLNPVQARSAR